MKRTYQPHNKSRKRTHGFLARSRAPEDTAREWGDLLHYTLDLYQLLALNAPGAPQVPPIEALRLAERELLDIAQRAMADEDDA